MEKTGNIQKRDRRFILHFLSLSILFLLSFASFWHFSRSRGSDDLRFRLSADQDIRSQRFQVWSREMEKSLRLIATQSTFLEDFKSFEDSLSKYATERRVKSPLPTLRTLLGQFYRSQFEENIKTQLGRGRSEDAVNLLSESSLAMQINYLQRSNGEERDFVNDGTRWSELHGRRINDWKQWTERLGVDNIHWVDVNRQNVIFSVSKGFEFSTSLKYGPFSQSHLAQFSNQLFGAAKNQPLRVSALEPEVLRWDDGRLYVGLIVEEDQRRLGAIIVELGTERLRKIFSADYDSGYPSTNFLVDSSSLTYWLPPSDPNHPGRKLADSPKMPVLDWMNQSKDLKGDHRWLPFSREGQEFWGSVKPLKFFDKELWFISEYTKNQVYQVAGISLADFQIPLLIAFTCIFVFSLVLSRARHDGDGADSQKLQKVEEVPVAVSTSNGHAVSPTPKSIEKIQPQWHLLEEPLSRVDRQLQREFENLKHFGESLKKQKTSVVEISELVQSVKTTLLRHEDYVSTLKFHLERRQSGQYQVRFPESWLESFRSSLRRLEVISYSFLIELKKGLHKDSHYAGLVEELQSLQGKMGKEMSSLEKWNLLKNDPIESVSGDSASLELMESSQSLANDFRRALEKLELEAASVDKKYFDLMGEFGSLKQSEGLSAAVVAIKASLESLKMEAISYEAAEADRSFELSANSIEDIENLFKEVSPANNSAKKSA